jgi:methyltransferase family protein
LLGFIAKFIPSKSYLHSKVIFELDKIMENFWNNRYRDSEWAYGEEPNVYFKKQLSKYKAGKILLPAEGEGRNAIFAAKLGWEVSAFDLSKEGKLKAENLAKKNNVQINYQVGGLSEIEYNENYFDCIALIYAHFPADVKSAYHHILDQYLRKNGIVILEAFSKSHLKFNSINEKAGGPKDINMLFSKDEIIKDFSSYKTIELVEKEVTLQEGLYHNGRSSVIRFLGKKV